MIKQIKTITGYWYRTPLTITHTCCKCNSKHIVKFKIKKGGLYSKWNPITLKKLK